MNPKQFAALFGFLFVAVWAMLDFGDALLCLLGAAVCYAATAFYRHELDINDIQARFPPQPPRGGGGRRV